MSTYSAMIIKDGPEAYYRLNESSGPSATDSSGHGRTGTYNGSGVTYSQAGAIAGDTDTCVTLNGTAGHINTPGGVSPVGWKGITVEAWVKLSTASYSQKATVWATGTTPTNTGDGFDFWIGPNGHNGGFAVGVSGTRWAQATFSRDFAAGVWYHVAGTWDGTTVTVFVNGVKNGSTGQVSGSIDDTGYTPTVGQDPQKGGDHFPGSVDEPAIYSNGLAPAKLQAHYAAGIAQIAPPPAPGAGSTYQANLITGTPGAVLLLIDNVWYPTIRQESISIARTASDPIPTFTFTLQDDPSHIPLVELAEVVFLDVGQIPQPTHNLLTNPAMSPYGSSGWHYTAHALVTPSQVSGGGLALAFANAAAGTTVTLSQTTQGGLLTGGQTYMASVLVAGSGSPTDIFASLICNQLSPTGALVSSTQLVGPTPPATGAPVQYSLPVTISPGTAYLQMQLVGAVANATNGGSLTFTQAQLEPMCFTSGANEMSYPSPWCDASQVNCIPMPDGTTVRQLRLFGGLVTKATAGNYIGENRQWQVTVSGYAWLLQKQLLNDSFTATDDHDIIAGIVAKYFPTQFSTAQVAVENSYANTLEWAYNGTARDAFDALASASNYLYYIDAYRIIWYQAPGYNILPFELSDTPDGITSFPYYAYTKDTDATQLGNVIYVTGATGIAAIVYDAQSIGIYAQQTNSSGQFWRTASDTSITDMGSAIDRGIGEASEYGYARPVLHLTTNQFIVPGYTMLFSSRTDGLRRTAFLVQQSTLTLVGFQSLQMAYYECQCDLGAFNPDLIQQLSKIRRHQVKIALAANQPQQSTYGPPPAVVPAIGLMATEDISYSDSVAVTVTATSPVAGVPISWYGTAGAVYGSNLVGYA